MGITKAVNRISAARLVYQDGAAATGGFPLSSAPTFVPGARVELRAGSGGESKTVFTGIVVKQALRVRDHSAPQLIVECRHAAVKLTVGRRSAYFLDQSDSDAITSLLEGAGLGADVESTALQHVQQVQFASTDWEYLLARAAANGLLVYTNGEKVSVKSPPSDGEAVLTLQFGATVLELDVELDARHQFKAVQGRTWDPAQQAVMERQAEEPRVPEAGNVAPDELASVMGLPEYPLAHPSLLEEEAQSWADAEWQRARLSKTSGRAKCEGTAAVETGDVVSLAGIGDRFAGKVLVTGVRHDFDLVQGWKTHLQFGALHELFAEAQRGATTGSSGLLPEIGGLQIGIVVSNEDPAGEHRVRVRMPLVSTDSDGAWARVAAVDAGSDRGLFIRPEIGDEVVLGFFGNDPRHPVILGMLHSSAHAAPLKGSDDNHEKAYRSRSGMRLYFDDEKKLVLLETPAGNRLTLDEQGPKVELADENGNRIELTSQGIRIESVASLELIAGGALTVESGTSCEITAGTDLKAQGASGAELSSAAVTKVSGSMLQLN